MTREPAGAGLAGIAQSYLDRWFPGRSRVPAGAVPNWDAAYCRRVAAYFDQAPERAWTTRLAARYRTFTRENLQQYQAIRAAGITVRPWPGPQQPYPGSRELREQVRATGVLWVYLTSAGHGPRPAAGPHPMLESSGIVVDDIALCHNDVFRAVHDIFGHVLTGNTFSARDELRAAHAHLRMYSEPAHPVLFTEQVAQICWYFFGPQAAARRYPEQKVFEFPRHFLDEFRNPRAGKEPR